MHDARHARAAAAAAAVWVAGEFLLSTLLFVALAFAMLAADLLPRTRELPPQLFALRAALLALTMAVLAWVFLRRVRRERRTCRELGYTRSPADVGAGLGAGLVLLATVSLGTHAVDNWLFGTAEAERSLVAAAASTRPIGVAMQAANGIMVPIVEEYAWRGYIQTHFTHAWGGLMGTGVTAALFAAKHMIVGLSYVRLTSLLVGSLALGVIRWRWGTTASTVSHLVLNFVTGLVPA